MEKECRKREELGNGKNTTNFLSNSIMKNNARWKESRGREENIEKQIQFKRWNQRKPSTQNQQYHAQSVNRLKDNAIEMENGKKEKWEQFEEKWR